MGRHSPGTENCLYNLGVIPECHHGAGPLQTAIQRVKREEKENI